MRDLDIALIPQPLLPTLGEGEPETNISLKNSEKWDKSDRARVIALPLQRSAIISGVKRTTGLTYV
ncbi:MAG: hypothetical protein SVX43_06035 [Cyanobacteriota bacterium]|nr:hypothetical protein [Cyanobacteriota bacterium]